jgi:trans-2,3-dihydro-3-hydroxyanthranilate isomerase
MKVIQIRHVDVFTDRIFSGNPLTVIPDSTALTVSEMQAIAAEFGTPETSFIIPPKSKADYGLRIFSPIKEIPFAGHPVIGAAHIFVSELSKDKETLLLTHETGIGVVPIQVFRERDSAKLVMDQGRPKVIGTLTKQQILSVVDALQLGRTALSKSTPRIISTGLPQLFIQLNELSSLSNMSPDLTKIKKIETKLGLTGVGVFTLETVNEDTSAHLRFFAPSIGISEDAAAGSAAGGLAAQLTLCHLLPNETLRDFSIEQGIEIGRPSRLFVKVQIKDGMPDDINVGGYSVTVSSGSIHLP